MIIHIMASCNFEGMKGKFLPSEYEEFFTEIFKNLEILLFNKGKKKVNVFESLKFEQYLCVKLVINCQSSAFCCNQNVIFCFFTFSQAVLS